MNIDELTVGQIKQIQAMTANCGPGYEKRHFFRVGQAYFVRSVTHHYLGTVESICELGVVMTGCVWIPDDGRFHKLMAGEWTDQSEREPYGNVCVMLFFGAILDASEWAGEVPKEVK